MDREKQIEEMARDLCNSAMCDLGTYDNCRLKIGNCGRCQRVAEDLYIAGYRKQSEGEWRSELVKKCDWKGKKHDYYQPNSCSLCHEAVLKRKPFCPNCGAKMKGENNEQREAD